ncbi:MAG: DNRLRE domain-containing protein [Methylobacter sp.]|nr:DNRLRE domain-containing protein [Methylobacter sp.]
MLTIRNQGFILLPVVLAITLIAGVAFLMNRDGAGNVNGLAGEIATTQAAYVARAGINQMLWQANNANCTGYVNASNVNLGGYSYSGTINPTSNSPVSISVTANNAEGAGYSIKRDRLKVYQSTVTKTLQLGTDAGKDTYIGNLWSTYNYGGGADDDVLTTKIGRLYRHLLIQFDLSTIPSNAHIVSAELQLYRKTGSGKDAINVYRIKQDWIEGSKTGSGTADGATWKTFNGTNTWVNPGGDYDPTLMARSQVDAGVSGVHSWEIAPLVQSWLTGKYPNYGMLLNASDSISVTFASKQDTTLANRPRLVITYNCECGLSCTTCISGNFRDEFSVSGDYSGNKGSLAWTGNWLETGESDGAGAGKLSVLAATQCTTGNCLKIRKDTATIMSVSRELKLANAVTASLSFSYRRTVVLMPGGGAITLEISKDGGATYTALKSYALDAIDYVPASETIDITGYIAAKTRIRFITAGASYQSNMHIDNIDVTVSCTPPPSSSHSVILNTIADTNLSEVNAGTNYGSSNLIWVGTNSFLKKYKGLLKFNVSSIPAGAIVTSAKLRLFASTFSGTGSMSIGIYKVIANWSESTATWTNFSSITNYNLIQRAVTTAPLASPVVVEWALPTSLINEWRDSVPTPNYGLALVYESILNSVYLDFASKENADTNLRPQLVIDYTLP